MTDYADLADRTRALLGDVLALDAKRTAALTDGSALFGALPELDSMAVAGLLTEIEDRFGITIDDDEVDGAWLADFSSLVAFIATKQAQSASR